MCQVLLFRPFFKNIFGSIHGRNKKLRSGLLALLRTLRDRTLLQLGHRYAIATNPSRSDVANGLIHDLGRAASNRGFSGPGHLRPSQPERDTRSVFRVRPGCGRPGYLSGFGWIQAIHHMTQSRIESRGGWNRNESRGDRQTARRGAIGEGH